MIGLEKDILYLISRLRYITENQVGKVFNSKKRSNRKYLKKTLRKMCNDYTLRKFPCNINYIDFKDNSYVYYLNGADVMKGTELIKLLIGSEIAIRMKNAGYEIVRFYRNPKIGKKTYDIFIEYINLNSERLQVVAEIDLEGRNNFSKYENIAEDIKNSTIPFFMLPKVLIVSSNNTKNNCLSNVYLIDTSLNKLFNYL